VENFKPNESFRSHEGTDDVIYNLVATINHQPTTKNQGHFTMVSRQHDLGIWYEYDNERVKVANFTKIIQGICMVKVPLQRAALMLFYVNKGPTSVNTIKD
jgi:hypothetical protein